MKDERSHKRLEWILRIALFGEFFGHGIFALQLKDKFLDMIISVLGVSTGTASYMLFTIGMADIIVAFFALVFPFRLLLIWASVWGFVTALARPLAGDPIWDFVERWPNWGIPLALLYIRGAPRKIKDWFT